MVRTLLCLLMLSVLFSCQREGEHTVTKGPDIINPPKIEIQGSVSGQIIGAQGEALDQVEISYNQQTYYTDENGIFDIPSTVLYADGTYLTANKTGFFQGSRTFYPIDGENNKVKIQMIPDMASDQFEASNGAEIYIEDILINFPAGVYFTEDNSAYTGTVQVKGKWLNWESESSFFEIPGDLTGVNLEKELKQLIPFGSLKLLIADSEGNELKLPEGKTAKIHVPVSSDKRQSAQSSLPLWHFDEQNGIWLEEGIANLENDSYIGDLPHLAFWSLNSSSNQALLTGNIKMGSSLVQATKIKLYNNENGFLAFGYTSDKGNFSLKAPSDISLNLDVFQNCNNANFTETLAPITETEINYNIEFSALSENIKIEGQAQDCQGLTSLPYAMLYLEHKAQKYLFRADMDGSFKLPFSSCDEGTFDLTIIDDQSGMISETQELAITNTIDLGDTRVCQEAQAGFNFDYNNIDWADAINMDVIQEWTLRTIEGSTRTIIINPFVRNINSNVVYYSGAFVFDEDSTQADYLLTFEAHGFSISGQCEMIPQDHGNIWSYRFKDVNHDIKIIDHSLIPDGITQVEFDVVYYN